MSDVGLIRLNLRAIKGRAYPRVIGANREPSWLFFETFLPLLSIAAYVFIYQAFGDQAVAAITADPSLPYQQQQQMIVEARAMMNSLIGFVVIGGTMTAFWLNVLWSMASQLYWEKEIGNLSLYMMAPMSRMALLGGMAIGGMFMTSTRAVMTLVFGVFVFGVVLSVANPFLLLAVFFVTLIALYGMGMMFASLYLLYGREAWNLSALMEEPIFLLSGFYFPVGALGKTVALAASVIPATLGLDALRQLMFPATGLGVRFYIFSPEIELAVLIVSAIIFLFLARGALAYLETLAKKEGRLTSRHQ